MREAIAPQTAAVAIAVIGLNIHFGFTGLLNMGQAGFMLLGAYGFAISSIPARDRLAVAALVAVIVGLAAAFLFALILGVPTLKLRGDYLAIVTISAAEIIRYIGRSVGYEPCSDFTGGAQGIPGSQYREPFTDLSPLGSGNTTFLEFNYADVADGAVWVRVVGWLIGIGIIVAIVQVARGKAGLTGTAKRGAVAGLSVVAALVLLFLAPVNNQNTGVNGWWVTVRRLDRGGAQHGARAAAGAQPVGAAAARRPRGRGRDPQPRQERLRDQDAGAGHRRSVRRARRDDLRPAGHRAAGRDGPLADVLLLHRAAARRGGDDLRARCSARSSSSPGGSSSTASPTPTCRRYHEHPAVQQFSCIVVGVVLMLLVIFRPQGILGDKRELRFNV